MSMRACKYAALLLCVWCTPRQAAAQTAAIQPGARVRITVPCADPNGPRALCTTAGDFVAVERDSIAIALGDSDGRFALADVTRIEVRAGRRSRTALLGAGAGFVAGTAATYLFLHSGGSNSVCDTSRNQDAIRPLECLGLVGLGGAAGAVVGGLVGAAAHTDHWHPIPLERLRLGLLSRPFISVAWRAF